MAKKPKIIYVCSVCGNNTSSWVGKCNSCGSWNSISEQLISNITTVKSSGLTLKSQSVNSSLHKDQPRIVTKLSEINIVLGGGIVKGSVLLLAGQPGIGKSTLLLQIANSIAEEKSVLYISAEESEHQVSLRATRLKISNKNLMLASSSSTNDIASTISNSKYDLVIVDSIQAITCLEISSSAGSISQITNSTQMLTIAAKNSNSALIIVGHVTKEGSIAGPKLLEHIVDVVLQLEGDKYGGFKILRANKNRFGSTDESAILEMTELGLVTVENPSASLLIERRVSDGSIVLATMEGSRPLLVEIQALVNKTSYGYPKRAASGYDLSRLNLLVAMLEKRTKLNLSDKDIYINVVGGIKLTEPDADLAICMAISSATKGLKLEVDAVVFGEIGLSGEIRHVSNIEKRINEAKKLGFKLVIGPRTSLTNKSSNYSVVYDIKSTLNSFLK